MPDNRGEAVKVLPGPNDRARVVIVKRADGYYAIRPEQWQLNVWNGTSVGKQWVPLLQPSGIFESAALAEHVAYHDYPLQPGSKPEKLNESRCFPLFTQ